MVPDEVLEDLARRGQQIYDERLRAELEKTHDGQFVAIEPDSGDYFLGRNLTEAFEACRQAHPGRLCYGLRVGEPAAIEIGSWPE
jgi:hypothetical protein